MSAPKDPNQKSNVTLDLNLDEVTKAKNKAAASSSGETTPPKMRSLEDAGIKPEKPPVQAKPQGRIPRPHPRRPQARKKPERNSKPLFIITGAVITAVLVSQYMMNKSMPALDTARIQTAPASKPAKTVATETLPQAAPPIQPPQDTYQGVREADLDQMPIQIDEKGRTFFAVRVKPRYVCYPGDIEAIRNVVGSTGSVLLSLEPMADGGKVKPPVTRTLSFQELTQGAKVSLPIDMSETGIYGIYICGDAAGQKSCGKKPAADFNKILNSQQLNIAANSVFYYQFAVLGLDYATVYSGMPSGIPAAREQLKNHKPQRDWKAELDKASSMMQGVKSLPPATVVEKNTVILELPLAMVNPDGSCR